MRKRFALLLALLWVFLLCTPVAAADDTVDEASVESTDVLADLSLYYDFEHRPLEDIMVQFRTEYGLDENNFAMAYYATGTGDCYGFQVDSFREAGYTYMVPMNLILYDKENAGELWEEDYIGTYYIPYLHKYTLTDSDVPMAKTIWTDLGGYREYRELITQYSDQSYTEEYYSENVFNIRYVMNVLWHIYDNSKDYPDLIEYMSGAYEGRAFDLKLENRFDVAHKYSDTEIACNDIAIIYTTEPFILAAFSQDVGHSEEMLGALAELMADYTEYLTFRKSQGLPAYTPLQTEPAPVDEGLTEAPGTGDPTPDTPDQTEDTAKEDGPVPVWVLILVIILAAALVVLAYMKGLVNGAKMERNRVKQTAWLRKKKKQPQKKS